MKDGLNTPYFSAAGSLMSEEQSDLGEMGDWTNTEVHPRDPNCVLEYGVKNGVAYFSKTQKNMDDWLAYAAIRREQYKSSSSKEKTKLMGIEKYGLPAVLVDDFNLRGLDVAAIMASSDHSDIDRIMIEEYPNLLWIPLSAMRTHRAVKNALI